MWILLVLFTMTMHLSVLGTSSLERNECDQDRCFLMNVGKSHSQIFEQVENGFRTIGYQYINSKVIDHLDNDDALMCICLGSQTKVKTNDNEFPQIISLPKVLSYVAEYNIYINYLPDEAANPSSCNTTLQSNSSQCNLRSAVALCAELFAVEATGSCVVHFPVSSDIISIDARLGDITISNTNGQLVLLGNGATVQMVKAAKAGARLLALTHDSTSTFTMSLEIHNLTATGFSSSADGVNGAALHVNRAESVLLKDVSFFNNKGDLGGAVNFNYITDLHVINCVFRDNSATYGASIYFDNGCLDVLIDGCLFESEQTAKDGGALFFSELYENRHTTIQYSNFTDNLSVGYNGGAVYFAAVIQDPVISHCIFTGNRAVDGGAVCFHSSTLNALIEDCRFIDNKVTGSGGGLYFEVDSFITTIVDCLFQENTALNDGGGIASHSTNHDMLITNCKFYSNGAVGRGGGINVYSNNNDCIVRGCFFYRNYANGPGGGLNVNFENLGFVLEKSIFRENAGEVGAGVSFGSYNSGFTLEYNLFERNRVLESGGALAIQDENDGSMVRNCTFVANEALVYAGAVFLISSNNRMVMAYNSFINNTCVLGGT
jgi:predicted outer membrane repeat protein